MIFSDSTLAKFFDVTYLKKKKKMVPDSLSEIF